MLTEKDRAVVAQMCRTGMNLETLFKCFPKFKTEDLKAIFAEENRVHEDEPFDMNISCNCS